MIPDRFSTLPFFACFLRYGFKEETSYLKGSFSRFWVVRRMKKMPQSSSLVYFYWVLNIWSDLIRRSAHPEACPCTMRLESLVEHPLLISDIFSFLVLILPRTCHSTIFRWWACSCSPSFPFAFHHILLSHVLPYHVQLTRFEHLILTSDHIIQMFLCIFLKYSWLLVVDLLLMKIGFYAWLFLLG